ncbi:MAG: hypothetical protein P4L75_06005, partial [Clostridia bacterium]|nr:hypothetical protein [Clostridia bacterium]
VRFSGAPLFRKRLFSYLFSAQRKKVVPCRGMSGKDVFHDQISYIKQTTHLKWRSTKYIDVKEWASPLRPQPG